MTSRIIYYYDIGANEGDWVVSGSGSDIWVSLQPFSGRIAILYAHLSIYIYIFFFFK